MPTKQPHLASWERRLVAAAIDASVLIVPILMLYFASSVFGLADELVLFLLALSYVGYQAIGALDPAKSLGRTVAGIVVRQTRGAGAVSTGTAVARGVVRATCVAFFWAFGEILRAEWIAVIPLLLDLALMAHTRSRRTLADHVVGTVVMNIPPVQPHRAPAFPMYSAKDEEFGPKP